MTCPDTGIYPGIPAAEYHGWDAASNSRLSRLLRSPRHLRAYLDEPQEDTPALLIGRATHAAVLEPDVFASGFVCAPEVDRRTKAGKEEWAAFCDANAGREVLSPADHALCLALRRAVQAHPAASTLLGHAGDIEVSGVWTDHASGCRCKLRADKLCGSVGVVVDLKTTQDAGSESFTRSIFSLGYHRQAAMYIDGLRANGLDVEHFVFVAVEKTPPYGVAVYRLTDEAIDAGRKQLRSLLATYRWCTERDEWPGYSDDIQDISLPRWAWSQIESEAL